jgi:DNA-binding FrmR family transcriptional regulator
MSAPHEEKSKLLKRLGRIRGQVQAIERALDGDASTSAVLQQATARITSASEWCGRKTERAQSTRLRS